MTTGQKAFNQMRKDIDDQRSEIMEALNDE